jgi:non-heme chloroperoxidase
MGGGTSLVAVGEDHVDATGLVLVDIAPRIESDGVDKIRAFMSLKPEGFDSLQEVAAAIASYQPHRKPPGSLSGLAKNVRLGTDGKFRWHWDPRFRDINRKLEERQLRLEDCARRLTLPTLLARGGNSDVLSETGAEEFLRLAPHSEYVNVTGAAHMVAGDRNDSFGHAVVEFLARNVPVDGQPVERPHPPRIQASTRPNDVNDIP